MPTVQQELVLWNFAIRMEASQHQPNSQKEVPTTTVSNYRPISLLSLISKAFERCIYNRLIEHVHGQIYELQYGFLRGRSTTSQLLHVLQQVLNVLEQKNQVDIVYLDFAKAFDKVSHNLLLGEASQLWY